MIRVFIVEDELPARDELKYLLLRTGQVEIVGEGEGMEDSLQQIRLLEPDLVFLDIELGQESGLELAEQIASWEHCPLIVFATAYDEHALRAFELKALDYILKPFAEASVLETLDKLNKLSESCQRFTLQKSPRKILGQKTEQVNRLAVSSGDRITMVKINEIVFIGSEERQVFVQTLDQRYLMDLPLYEMETKLASCSFLRVHRGYLINLNHILEIEPWFNGTLNLFMEGGYKVPVSRSYLKAFKNSLDL